MVVDVFDRQQKRSAGPYLLFSLVFIWTDFVVMFHDSGRFFVTSLHTSPVAPTHKDTGLKRQSVSSGLGPMQERPQKGPSVQPLKQLKVIIHAW